MDPINLTQRFSLCLILLLCIRATPASRPDALAHPPVDICESLWMAAMQGKLLNSQGWDDAAKRFYTRPTPFPGLAKVVVRSNDWGPPSQIQMKADSADVVVGFEDQGSIDSLLRYSPPKKTDAIKTGMQYHLVTVQGYNIMYGPDGKTIVSKTPSDVWGWQIEGSPVVPWTTVNTAIRYVLEARAKTENLAIRRNANETIAKLLTLN